MTSLAATAFSVSDLDICRGDVVLFGIFSGTWPPFVARTRAAVQQFAQEPPDLPVEAVRAAAERFRRARGLLSAQDLRQWLDARGLTLEDLAVSLQRVLAAGTVGAPAPDGTPPTLSSGSGPSSAAIERAVEVDAWTSGVLEACGRGLCDRVIAARRADPAADRAPQLSSADLGALVEAARQDPSVGSLGEEELLRRFERIVGWQAAYDAFVAQVSPPTSVAAVLAENGADWTTLVVDVVPCATEDVAREVRLAVHEDGADLAELAASLGVSVKRLEQWAGELPDGLRGALIGAAPGDLTAPVPFADRWGVARLLERRPPDPEDPRCVARAREVLVEEALRTARAELTQWRL